jgi:hypothetical protein
VLTGTSQPPENDAVLGYLVSERMASPDTNTAWVIDGYSLSTHPDLCDRVKQINDAAGRPAGFRWIYGRPTLFAKNGVIVAFATGTYVFCLRLPRSEVDARLVGERKEDLSAHELLRRKQEELDALVSGDWTRVDPWTVDVPKAEGLRLLSSLLMHAVERVTSSSPP